MMFIMQMLMFSGGRPGAFVPSGYYPDIYLEYRDIDFLLGRHQGKEKFAISLVQRWRKGEKDKIDAK
jgi:hypothetical protein